MSIETAARRGREMAARQMTDRVRVSRPLPGEWTEDDQGNSVPATTVVHAELPAWIRVLAQQSRIVESGGQPVSLHAYDVLLPHEVEGLRVQDLVTVLSTSGPDLQNRTLTVVEVTWGTHQVARRLVCRAQMATAT